MGNPIATLYLEEIKATMRGRFAWLGAAVVLLVAAVGYLVRPHHSATPACGQTVLPFSGIDFRLSPGGVAVDTAGNVYVVTSGDNAGVMRLVPGSSSWTRLPGDYDFRAAAGLAVDARGNVYVTDNLAPGRGAHSSGLVVKLPAG